MSRGGEAAYSVALEVLRRHYEASDIRFAAHVSISPGSCNLQQRDARTTGAPMFFMLAELDDGTPALPCVEYIERMRTAGNANIRWAVYPGVYHAYEWTGGIGFAPDDWTARACAGRFWRDEWSRLYDRSSGQRATQGNQTDFLFRTCLQTGYTIGGDERVKAQATADLIQFLRDAEILSDAEARAICPTVLQFRRVFIDAIACVPVMAGLVTLSPLPVPSGATPRYGAMTLSPRDYSNSPPLAIIRRRSGSFRSCCGKVPVSPWTPAKQSSHPTICVSHSVLLISLCPAGSPHRYPPVKSRIVTG